MKLKREFLELCWKENKRKRGKENQKRNRGKKKRKFYFRSVKLSLSYLGIQVSFFVISGESEKFQIDSRFFYG